MKVGDKINCWTIININPPPEHRYHLLCRCVCGNEKWVSGSALRRGKSKSCGCQKHRNQKKYILKPGDNVAAIIKSKNKKRGANWDKKYRAKCKNTGYRYRMQGLVGGKIKTREPV